MPPKFAPLKLQVSIDEDRHSGSSSHPHGMGERNINLESLRLNNDGITVMSNSLNPYSFSTQGLSKGGQEVGMYGKISERDIRILKRLGAGAGGDVWKGFYFKENRFVAVKKIRVFEKEKRSQMMNDIKALVDSASTNNPHLISFYGAFHIPDSGQIAIVLEYMDGGSLADVMKKTPERKIPENVLSKITSKILIGLRSLHKERHTIHRDIKPANILINLMGEPKITDFGISSFMDNTLDKANTFLGTQAYMSPERLQGCPYDISSDIWSLGLTLVEAATGKWPFPDCSDKLIEYMMQVMEHEVPMVSDPSYSSELRAFVSLCLLKDPLKRPQAEELLTHPFILKHQSDPVSLRDFMQCVFDPQEKLDEIAVVFAWNYFALLSAGKLTELAPLYSEASVLHHDGVRCAGSPSIVSKLREVAQMNLGFKIEHKVLQVDCQPLGSDGSALVHVHGHLVTPLSGGPGGQALDFNSTFVLTQFEGVYTVASQMYRVWQH